MEMEEVMRRARKELESAKRNLATAKERNAPALDIQNLEKKVDFRQTVLSVLSGYANGGDE